jgi:hypothetical protein
MKCQRVKTPEPRRAAAPRRCDRSARPSAANGMGRGGSRLAHNRGLIGLGCGAELAAVAPAGLERL